MSELEIRIKNFRENLYYLFPQRKDAILNLLDAISADADKYNSVVQLSKSEFFKRKYSSITDAINALKEADFAKIEKLIYKTCSTEDKKLKVFYTDCTSCKRLYSPKLEDRTVVYSPNKVPGNKPITVGHQYSSVVLSPDNAKEIDKNWVIPLSMQRVTSKEKGNEVGMQHLIDSIKNCDLNNELVLTVGDSLYGTEECRSKIVDYENIVHCFRIRNNRRLFKIPEINAETSQKAGRKKIYGDKISLKNEKSLPSCDESFEVEKTTKSGNKRIVEIKLFKNLLLEGSGKFNSSEHPINLIKVIEKDTNGKQVHPRPLWLGVIGKQKDNIKTEIIYFRYDNRFDIEHFFKFEKQKQMIDSYQSPDVSHEESWWNLVPLAYVQLYLANQLGEIIPEDWMRYLPEYKKLLNLSDAGDLPIKTASQIQKCFANILTEIDTPAKKSISRGKPIGRKDSEVQPKRNDYEIIFKNEKNNVDKKENNLSVDENSSAESENDTIDLLLSSVIKRLKKLNLSAKEFAEKLNSS